MVWENGLPLLACGWKLPWVHTPSNPYSDSQASAPTTMVAGENRFNRVSLGPAARGGGGGERGCHEQKGMA